MKESLYLALKGEQKEFASIPFWSWNNNLDEAYLISQIEDMKKSGIGGFIMHARTGLKDEYLGEKWFSCIEACLKKARELNMEAWIYDENGWPSGFVGGKLLENYEFRARFLEYAVGAFEKDAFAVFVKDETRGFIRVTEEREGVEEYHNIRLGVSPSNTDILNPAVTEAFIRETHEKYFERFPESFGRELAGFFTDEPQYYRWATPYTPCAEEIFSARGEDIRDGLVWLFVKDERGYAFREKYYEALNRLYVENFYKKLYDWCHAHGCQLTGHSLEECALAFQMWGCASIMPSYEYEDIPGVDWLGRTLPPELMCRQVGSVASQFGKRQVLTETFACSGNDVKPSELKKIGETQYFNGVNKMCQHLYPYSMAGRGKTDHPPVFGRHSNWFEEFKAFNEYFNRLGYVIGNTKEQVDIAVLHPMRDIWLNYLHAEGHYSVACTEAPFAELLEGLRKHGVTYHFLDERLLAKHGKAENGTLTLGECSYSTVVVPNMSTISKETVEILQRFDGKLCMVGTPTHIDGERKETGLVGNTSLEEIYSATAVKFSCEDGKSYITARSGEVGEFLFIKNNNLTEESKVSLKGVAQAYVALDLHTLAERNISNELTLKGGEGLILVKDEKAKEQSYDYSQEEITQNLAVTGVTENYLVMDYAEMSKDGVHFGKKFPVQGLFEELLREDYQGNIVVKQTFNLKEKMPLRLIVEKANYEFITVNGKQITLQQSEFDVNFAEAQIDGHIKTGENELRYGFYFHQHDGVHFALFDPMATESVKNCLYFDTSIEPTYLKGDFTVEKDFSLTKRTALPPLSTALCDNGYPFFKGELTVKGRFAWKAGKKTYLRADGRFLVASVIVNGQKKELILDEQTEITPLLQEGENEVELIVKSSLRNLFGPLHFKPEKDPAFVSPYNFDFRGTWVNGDVPSDYTHEYNSVPFGVDSVYLIYEE